MFRHIARTDDLRWLGESLAGGVVFEEGISHVYFLILLCKMGNVYQEKRF